MSSEPIEDAFERDEEKWAPLIGRFILEFANIEDSIHLVTSYHLAGTIIEHSDINERLGIRLNLCKKILEASVEDQCQKIKIQACFNCIQDLVQTRNLLAHNALSIVFEEGNDGHFRQIGPVIAGRKNINITIDFESLTAKLADLRSHRLELRDFVVTFLEKRKHGQ